MSTIRAVPLQVFCNVNIETMCNVTFSCFLTLVSNPPLFINPHQHRFGFGIN